MEVITDLFAPKGSRTEVIFMTRARVIEFGSFRASVGLRIPSEFNSVPDGAISESTDTYSARDSDLDFRDNYVPGSRRSPVR